MGTRPTRRGHGGNRNFSLWSPETDQGWRVVRQVSFAEGENKCARGEWRPVEDGHGNRLGYQVLANRISDESLVSGASSISISVKEVELNAGAAAFKRSKSQTAGMPEEQRIARRHPKSGKPLPPEDEIERATEKVKAWPYPQSRIDNGKGKPVFGDRAVRVYPQAPAMRRKA